MRLETEFDQVCVEQNVRVIWIAAFGVSYLIAMSRGRRHHGAGVHAAASPIYTEDTFEKE
jgi:hypothetical protein